MYTSTDHFCVYDPTDSRLTSRFVFIRQMITVKNTFSTLSAVNWLLFCSVLSAISVTPQYMLLIVGHGLLSAVDAHCQLPARHCLLSGREYDEPGKFRAFSRDYLLLLQTV